MQPQIIGGLFLDYTVSQKCSVEFPFALCARLEQNTTTRCRIGVSHKHLSNSDECWRPCILKR